MRAILFSPSQFRIAKHLDSPQSVPKTLGDFAFLVLIFRQ
jgi:hypothetical protein